MGSLRDLCAHELAAKHVEYYRMTHGQANSLYRHQLNRKWGHTIALHAAGLASFSTGYGNT